jgi:hypothetical protein
MTETESMVERVAKAIVAELGRQEGYDDPKAIMPGLKISYLDQGEVDMGKVARAAIEAMRWPTDGMRSAGARRGNWSENELGNEWDCADNVWFAMIDKALEKDMER